MKALLNAAALLLALGASALSVSACYKFAGSGGFPTDLKTVAILPFDNLTPSPEVQRELNDAVRKSFHDRLSLRDAPEDRADVIVKGVIAQYDTDVPTGISANSAQVAVSRRTLQLLVNIEVLNTKTGKSLFKQDGMRSEGQYAEGKEIDGRKLAIESLVDQIIQHSQSQW
ncbi:MAG: LPS assembly lipoprotein LptE [Gemmatimonas sp.]